MATALESAPQAPGFYCSTSGTYFHDKESLAEHYKSDFHRYNLKRKVAGLPPVTKEWFEARKAQLASASASAGANPATRVWVDPLTKKKFSSENTYQAFVRSKKYVELVKKGGQEAPAPVILTKQQADAEPSSSAAAAAPAAVAKAAGFKVVAPSGGLPLRQAEDVDGDAAMADGSEDGGSEDGGSGWETASDDEEVAAGQQQAKEDAMQEDTKWAEWDLCRSLFDNHMSASFQANLEYMLKKFGFYFPDAEYLKDPEGLMRYLGMKLQAGGAPLYVRGDDANARQFRSLHAVQRHMVDTNQCKVLYDDNEEEYADFYDYDMLDQQGEDGEEAGPLALVAGVDEGADVSGAIAGELVLAKEDGGARILGTRDLARYYRQRHRAMDERQSVVINTMLSRYRALGAPTNTNDKRDVATKKEATVAHRHYSATKLKMGMIKNVLKKLPKNCEY